MDCTSNIPIFDTLSHPTLNGNWISPKYDESCYIKDIITDMRTYNIKKAFAVGINHIGDYDENRFINTVLNEGNELFLPIAFFEFNNLSIKDIRHRLLEIRKKGYVGIKLHPRIANFLLSDKRLPYIIDFSNELNLIPLLCTFFYCNHQSMVDNNVDRLSDLLLNCSIDSDIILVHGGLTRLLETMELVRFFPNTVLDLSLTMCKYEGTHLDLDIEYIFKFFDRRTVIGTDSPEINHETLRRRFDYFASKTTQEKAENIAYKNIESVLTKHHII